MTVVLGSQSPRRREIMSYFKLPFIVAVPPFDEEKVVFKNDPTAYALEISRGKAKSLISQFPDQPIITADTVVYCNGKIYGKAANDAEALQNLQELSGQWCSVFTGMTLVKGSEQYEFCEESRILLKEASLERLEKYHKNVPCLDKAGSFSVQLGGGIIARRVEGCHYNAMGLPLAGLEELLAKVNIDLWDYLC